jgi:uncharacterized protein YkwD
MATLNTHFPATSRRIRRTLAVGAFAVVSSLAFVGLAPDGASAFDCSAVDTIPTRSTSPYSSTRDYEDGRTKSRAAEAVICLTNQQRMSNGLAAVAGWPEASTSSPQYALNQAAVKHSHDMAAQNYFSHVSPACVTAMITTDSACVRYRLQQRVGGPYTYWPGYCSPSCSSWGENIRWATGSASTPRATVQAWMASPGHRANILSTRYRDIGVGVSLDAPTSYTGQAATYTQMFGSR